jgi:hypothetical protein
VVREALRVQMHAQRAQTSTSTPEDDEPEPVSALAPVSVKPQRQPVPELVAQSEDANVFHGVLDRQHHAPVHTRDKRLLHLDGMGFTLHQGIRAVPPARSPGPHGHHHGRPLIVWLYSDFDIYKNKKTMDISLL